MEDGRQEKLYIFWITFDSSDQSADVRSLWIISYSFSTNFFCFCCILWLCISFDLTSIQCPIQTNTIIILLFYQFFVVIIINCRCENYCNVPFNSGVSGSASLDQIQCIICNFALQTILFSQFQVIRSFLCAVYKI